MQIAPYLSFKGDCEAAFSLYEKCLGAKRGPMFRYGESPVEAPQGWADKIMHGSVTVGGIVLMGADVTADRFEPAKGTSLSVHVSSADEAERVFRDLGEGGTVLMPLEKTFWAERFGMLVDRFGVPWMINCEAAGAAQ